LKYSLSVCSAKVLDFRYCWLRKWGLFYKLSFPLLSRCPFKSDPC